MTNEETGARGIILNSKFFIRNSSFSPGLFSTALTDRLVDQLLEFLPRLEVGNLFRRDFDFLSGFRIAAGARFATAQTEAAEAAQLDLLSGAKRLDDRVEHDVDDRLRLLLRQLNNARHLVDEFSLRHHARFGFGPFGFRRVVQSSLLTHVGYQR